jgi:hypothetical protein
MSQWVHIFGQARPLGFIFFEVYMNESSDQALGWIARVNQTEPYRFYRLGHPTGEGMTIGTRGSYKNAEAAVEAASGVTVGIYPVRLPELTVQIIQKGLKK